MLRLAIVCTAGILLAQATWAQGDSAAENPANNPTELELKSLRETVQLQSQQLDKISQQLEEVLHRLGGKAARAAASSASEERTGTASAPSPAVETASPSAPPAAKEAPKAQLAEGQTLHVVKKGETLTAIARQNNVTVDELQKANHITDGRRLQIDQNLIIPAPSSGKTTTPSPEPSAH